ncbi:hypothetical protein TNIN_149351 [Trichonephila inaurata madagascariensis]|uniref:Uncharacterized protein n=1 Tax=Trichonephila inaurata madagascariensis TaxID=2747483 RepID=A0A8X6JC09_9ARAC|nr:hypothetical protein TNIN_149351 [Trichonephila inaurata madagascariensis]
MPKISSFPNSSTFQACCLSLSNLLPSSNKHVGLCTHNDKECQNKVLLSPLPTQPDMTPPHLSESYRSQWSFLSVVAFAYSPKMPQNRKRKKLFPPFCPVFAYVQSIERDIY